MKKRLIKATDFYGCDWFFDPKYIIGMTATDYDEWDDNKREFIKNIHYNIVVDKIGCTLFVDKETWEEIRDKYYN